VTGNVLLTSRFLIIKKIFGYYLNSVGGVDNKGWKKKSLYYLSKREGSCDTSSFCFSETTCNP
jgi:glucan-binding YG repeat protein